jgi:hypothetical protein
MYRTWREQLYRHLALILSRCFFFSHQLPWTLIETFLRSGLIVLTAHSEYQFDPSKFKIKRSAYNGLSKPDWVSCKRCIALAQEMGQCAVQFDVVGRWVEEGAPSQYRLEIIGRLTPGDFVLSSSSSSHINHDHQFGRFFCLRMYIISLFESNSSQTSTTSLAQHRQFFAPSFKASDERTRERLLPSSDHHAHRLHHAPTRYRWLLLFTLCRKNLSDANGTQLHLKYFQTHRKSIVQSHMPVAVHTHPT